MHPVITLSEILQKNGASLLTHVSTFLRSIEKLLKVTFVRPTDIYPYGLVEYADLFLLANRMRDAGLLLSLNRSRVLFHDEPPFPTWSTLHTKDEYAGASSITSEREAIIKALAEGVERHLWRHETDYFLNPIRATCQEIEKRGMVPLSRYAGISEAQRRTLPALSLDNAANLWIQAYSYISKKHLYIPAQMISGSHTVRGDRIVRPSITTGLAAHVTRSQALLSGALEIIERDAYMIMWLNQLSYPTIALDTVAAESSELQVLLRLARRFNLDVRVARLHTDAPAHCVCAVVRDYSGVGPSITVGLGAAKHLPSAISHALQEALRIRRLIRSYNISEESLKNIVPSQVEHVEHATYWLYKERHSELAFITQAPEETPAVMAWENDTDDAYLKRIIAWCTTKEYEFLSVDVSRSKKCIAPWNVQFVIIPEMQPMHLIEKYPCAAGKRLEEVPKQFGFSPRAPFLETPHPFV